MPRKLKSYQTSQGFFDLAVAAPTMKAALEAWGHQGFAEETSDSRIIAATMAQPGVVLKRPVGTVEPFQEHTHLPTSLPSTGRPRQRPKKSARPKQTRKSSKKAPAPVDEKAARKAALAFEKEQRRRDQQRKKEEAAAEKARQRWERVMAAAETALEDARHKHDEIAKRIAEERDALETRADAEETRWEKEKMRLQAALHRASR
jgi:hypothetical protein